MTVTVMMGVFSFSFKSFFVSCPKHAGILILVQDSQMGDTMNINAFTLVKKNHSKQGKL